MVDIVEIIRARGPLGFTQLRYVVYEATVSTNDTVTLGELLGLIYNKSYRMDTGAVISTSVSGTVVEVTEAGLTNMPIVGLAIVGDPGQSYFPYDFPYMLS